MPYTTLSALIDRYGEAELIQLTDRAGTGEVDEAIIDRAIADAGAEIDAYLAQRVTLPLDPVPEVLGRFASVMARYYLYNEAPTELVQTQYNAAVAFLRDVARGLVSLGPSESGTATPATDAPSYHAGTPVFDDAGMVGF